MIRSSKRTLAYSCKDFAGRPTPLYFADRLSEKYGTRIFLKREDLCHTGAHKINNTIGQILLAEKLGKKELLLRQAPVNMALLPQQFVR